MQIELTQGEAQALMQLLDLAVKAGGMSVAQAALHIAAKIESAAKPAEPTE